LLSGGESHVVAALDPLAVPLFCGLENQLRRFGPLVEALRSHARTCLQPGVCVDRESGGLRLSSVNPATWVSKCALVVFVVEWLENQPITRTMPSVESELVTWMQVSSAEVTVADQIQADSRLAVGGFYYPRCVTLALLLGGDASGL
jgi:hypothetical protein